MSSFEARNSHFDRLFATQNLYWLGQNTNHLPMHPAIRQALMASIESEEFHAYAPPGGFESLRHAIVEDLGLQADAMAALVTDGAVAALATVCRAYCGPGTNFVTTDPGWKWPMQFARQAGAEVREIPIYDPDAGYRLTAHKLAENVDRDTRIIYLVDPNNPLGIRYTRDEMGEFCDIARKVDALVLHDCTYRDFAENHTLAASLYPQGAITIYSFSKWLGLCRPSGRRCDRQPRQHREACGIRDRDIGLQRDRAARGRRRPCRQAGMDERCSRHAAPQSSRDQRCRRQNSGSVAAGLSVARQLSDHRMCRGRLQPGSLGCGLCRSRHHDQAGRLPHAALRLAIREGEHHGAVRMDRCILSTVAAGYRGGTGAKRRAAAVLERVRFSRIGNAL